MRSLVRTAFFSVCSRLSWRWSAYLLPSLDLTCDHWGTPGTTERPNVNSPLMSKIQNHDSNFKSSFVGYTKTEQKSVRVYITGNRILKRSNFRLFFRLYLKIESAYYKYPMILEWSLPLDSSSGGCLMTSNLPLILISKELNNFLLDPIAINLHFVR